MILICYGTRPELIKLFPLVREMKNRNIPYQTLFTGQHKHLIKEYSHLIDRPTYKFNVFKLAKIGFLNEQKLSARLFIAL